MQFWKIHHGDSELLPPKFMASDFIQKINLGKIRGEEDVDDEEEVKEEEELSTEEWSELNEI